MFEYQAPANLLENRVILVTGAGDGIGRAAALTYARHGATVILLGRTTEKLEKVYDEIESAGYPQPAIIPFNLEGAAPHDYDAIADTIAQEFGRLDGLLHNAGLLGRLGPLFQYDPDTWQQVMQVNVNAEFMLTKVLLPLLREAPEASVVFTSSSVGSKGRAHWGAYSVSKFATEGLMQVLADEEDGLSQVRSNAINPGATRTAMRAKAYPGEDPNTLPAAEDIMPVYLYLMGSDSREVNGQVLKAQ
ncbi:YciK family oxidoreductase [Parendozoicomonas haliclonae]|uniref:Putative oxidoreductase YciK n=1 Tax=Parendozoicomonas haliclonae TaxID=1960125 RepID=A0A1X7AHI5_9GAMM|nr:YciK family oxidoreductase [Parendozoicomonas haliclonae]SMA41619.1 putative oxidoreductase YciK [Parendozoicomonas haliclonae]